MTYAVYVVDYTWFVISNRNRIKFYCFCMHGCRLFSFLRSIPLVDFRLSSA